MTDLELEVATLGECIAALAREQRAMRRETQALYHSVRALINQSAAPAGVNELLLLTEHAPAPPVRRARRARQ